jgi:hypothetical protein
VLPLKFFEHGQPSLTHELRIRPSEKVVPIRPSMHRQSSLKTALLRDIGSPGGRSLSAAARGHPLRKTSATDIGRFLTKLFAWPHFKGLHALSCAAPTPCPDQLDQPSHLLISLRSDSLLKPTKPAADRSSGDGARDGDGRSASHLYAGQVEDGPGIDIRRVGRRNASSGGCSQSAHGSNGIVIRRGH